ncbi:hypothetical protein LWC05_16960, partial [Acetobacter sicerae]
KAGTFTNGNIAASCSVSGGVTMMGDPVFCSILSGIAGFSSGVSVALVWVFLGEMESAARMRRRDRIDGARVAAGTLRRRRADYAGDVL